MAARSHSSADRGWQRHRLTWLDRQGKVIAYLGQPVTIEGVRLSPDERYVVSYVASPNADIARFDVATGEQRRLTFDTKTEDWPTWSPDGRRVAYRQIVAVSTDHAVGITSVRRHRAQHARLVWFRHAP